MADKHIPPTFQQAVAATDPQFVKDFREYNVSNPHPGFGKDPNILNEFGHTKFPKWVTKPNGESVIVNSDSEEAEALGKEPAELKQNGPTIGEYVAAGFDPNTYPPKGYASKSSDEEIKTFRDKHSKAAW